MHDASRSRDRQDQGKGADAAIRGIRGVDRLVVVVVVAVVVVEVVDTNTNYFTFHFHFYPFLLHPFLFLSFYFHPFLFLFFCFHFFPSKVGVRGGPLLTPYSQTASATPKYTTPGPRKKGARATKVSHPGPGPTRTNGVAQSSPPAR